MKYAVLFTIAGVLLVALAATHGGWYLLFLWPATGFGFIGLAYLRGDPSIFGKRADGSVSHRSQALLLPYLLYVWIVWHVIRRVSREDAFNQLTEHLTIGRRLLPSELPEHINVVVDLTCEFAEARPVRMSREYLCYPILDGFIPSPESLASIAQYLAQMDGHIFIHCAQGHGRTGLVAAALLLAKGQADDVADAIDAIRSERPLVRLGGRQIACLQGAAELITPSA